LTVGCLSAIAVETEARCPIMRIDLPAIFLPVLLAISASAEAADLPVLPAPISTATPLPEWCWTGVYVGLAAGGARDTLDVVENSFGFDFNSRRTSFLAGTLVGINAQFGHFVAGVEGDLDWIINNGSADHGLLVPGLGSVEFSTNNRWLAT